MLTSAEVVFLLDVDSTFLDRDRFGADLTGRKPSVAAIG
jgi:hypothetical protein